MHFPLIINIFILPNDGEIMLNRGETRGEGVILSNLIGKGFCPMGRRKHIP